MHAQFPRSSDTFAISRSNKINAYPETHSRNESGYINGKKGSAVEHYFKGKKFTGSPKQSLENLFRNFEICDVKQSLNSTQISLFFVNSLADPALQYFLTHCSIDIPFDLIVLDMKRH